MVADPFTAVQSPPAPLVDPTDLPEPVDHHVADPGAPGRRGGGPPPDGMGTLVGGIVLLGLGAALVGGGLAVSDNASNSAGTIGGILLATLGAPPVVGGVTMIAVGGVRRARFNQWRRGLAIEVAPAGLRLAF